MAPHKQLTMREKKRIALVAHDNMKSDLYEWATYNTVLPERFAAGARGGLSGAGRLTLRTAMWTTPAA